MARIAYVNGSYINHLEAAVHIEDRGYQFADGVYEYMAFYNRIILDVDLHLKRLERSLKELQIAAPMSMAALRIVIAELIARNGREDGGLYLQISRGVAKRDHVFPKHVEPSLVMTVCGAKTPKPQEMEKGVKVMTAPDIRWGRRDIKSISLLANILAKQEAAKQGLREVWLVEGKDYVSEGSASNVYIVTGKGVLVTHPANEHILGGVTRDVVLELARKSGISVEERPFSLREMSAAAEAFMTSTSINVLPVTQIDGKAVGDGSVGEVTRKLQQLYNAHIFKQTGKQF